MKLHFDPNQPFQLDAIAAVAVRIPQFVRGKPFFKGLLEPS